MWANLAFFDHAPESTVKMNKILTAFLTDVQDYYVEPIKIGLIHSSYLVKKLGQPIFVLQKINTTVFPHPEIIASNQLKIQQALKEQDPAYPALTLLPTIEGQPFYTDAHQQVWRLVRYISRSTSIEKVTTAEQASKTARAFGRFSSLLQQLVKDDWQSAIPRFHDLTWRYRQWETALENAHSLKKEKAAALIHFLQQHQFLVHLFQKLAASAAFPVRMQHADTKISNILFDEHTLEPLCVIDWDTVMPGYFLSDLGDMVRTLCFTAGENETALDRISWKSDYFEAIVAAYTDTAALTEKEKKWIPFAGPFMIYQQALRFLTDYLSGDCYYQINYPGHNFDRAANQCHILSIILNQVPLHPD